MLAYAAAFIAALIIGLAIVRCVKSGGWWVDFGSTVIAAFSIVVFMKVTDERYRSAKNEAHRAEILLAADDIVFTAKNYQEDLCFTPSRASPELCSWLGAVRERIVESMAADNPYSIWSPEYPVAVRKEENVVIDAMRRKLDNPIFPRVEATEFIPLDMGDEFQPIQSTINFILGIADRLWPFLFFIAFGLKFSKHAYDNSWIKARWLSRPSP
jgi:hypothetical protein